MVVVRSGDVKSQRREPAADEVELVNERTGWLPFAAGLRVRTAD
jgi:hypothetical protein